MIFDLNNYQGAYAMHCPSHDKALFFLKYLHEHGRHWCDRISYLEKDNYERYTNRTCYAFNEGSYCGIEFFTTMNTGYILLSFDDFYWDGYSNSNECLNITDKDNQKFNVFISSILCPK